MKYTNFALSIALTLPCGFALGQSANPAPLPPGVVVHTPQPAVGDVPPAKAPASFSGAQAHRYAAIQYYMRFPSPLELGDQLLAGMGDEAAADLLIALAAAPPLSAAQMQTAMDIVHKAFARPRAIPPQYLKPTSALKVLQTFQATATDQLVKERIAAETNFLNAVPQVIPPLTLPANAVFGPNPFPPLPAK